MEEVRSCFEGRRRWVETQQGEGPLLFFAHLPAVGLTAGSSPVLPCHRGEKLPELSFWMFRGSSDLTRTQESGSFTKGLRNGNLIGEARGKHPAATLTVHHGSGNSPRSQPLPNSAKHHLAGLAQNNSVTFLSEGLESSFCALLRGGRSHVHLSLPPPAC